MMYVCMFVRPTYGVIQICICINIYIYVGEVQIPTRPFIGGPMKGALHLLITNSYLVPNLMVKLLFTPHQVGYFLIE